MEASSLFFRSTGHFFAITGLEKKNKEGLLVLGWVVEFSFCHYLGVLGLIPDSSPPPPQKS